MMKRQAYYSVRHGVGNLKLIEENIAPPAPGEVQIAVRAIGINFADVISMLSLYSAAPARPFVPGLEFSGTVAAVGEGVSEYRVGDRVMGVRFFGTYATALNVGTRFLTRLPDGWGYEEGAAQIVASLTAYYALVDQARVRQGETVLVQSAAGGVGLAALRVAKAHGCFAIGAVGDSAKAVFCKEQGYDAVVVRGPHFKESLTAALGGRRLDIALDTMGGKDFKDTFDLLGPQGRMVSYGYSRYVPRGLWDYPGALWRYMRRPRIDSFRLDNRLISAFNLVYLFDKAEQMQRYMLEMGELGIGTPASVRTYPFERLPDALRELASGRTIGKLVVAV